MNVCKGPLSAMCGEMCAILSCPPRPSPSNGDVAGDLLIAADAPLTDGHASFGEDWLLLRELLLCKLQAKKTNDNQGANQKNS